MGFHACHQLPLYCENTRKKDFDQCGNIYQLGNQRKPMFCPRCGTLAHPSPSGDITCPNYKCGYVGPANAKVIDSLGREIDLAHFSTQSKPKERDYSVIKDSDLRRMYGGHAECPRCPNTESFTYLYQTLYGADEDIVKTILFCEKCGKDFKKD